MSQYDTSRGSGLRARRVEMARVLIQGFVAPELPREAEQLELAAVRLEDFLAAQAKDASAVPLRVLLLALYAYTCVRFFKRPARLTDDERRRLLELLCEPERTVLGRLLDFLARVSPLPLPSGRDLGRGLREMMVAAYYSHPSTDQLTGYTPIWKREDILRVEPTLTEPPARLPLIELAKKQREGSDVAHGVLFANDGRPRVAVIGSGAGGAVVAAQLAGDYDVAVFEAGPSLTPPEYPLDTLSGMALLFQDGLMSFTKNYDIHLMLGRLVGGGTTLTSGMSIRPRKRTLEAWQRAGLDLDAMHAGLAAVERRLRMEPISEDLLTDLGHFWRGKEGHENNDLIFEVPKSNTATRASQHANDPHGQFKRGDRCLACGLCNYGCRFGHKLSVDLTYLPDARARGARVHPNLPVERLVSKRDPISGEAKIVGLVLERDKQGAMVEVDYVVLAAGAVGSPALLLRSMRTSDALARIPGAAQVGRGLGFNYGTPVVADWGKRPPRPGDTGVQIHYVASKPSDERYVLENAFLPPALMSSVVPGIGGTHREWMLKYRQLAMAVTTIGSPSSGSVDAKGRVSYQVSSDEMGVIQESLATLVRSYLRAGAARVGVSGVRRIDDPDAVFFAGEQSSPEKLLEKIKRLASEPDRLMLMSAHPQGGLRLHHDPAHGAVSPSFNVHGVRNLMVADASLFPSTVVVNPQWSVMGLASVAAQAIHERIARDHAQLSLAAE